jgi:hypothetical protein
MAGQECRSKTNADLQDWKASYEIYSNRLSSLAGRYRVGGESVWSTYSFQCPAPPYLNEQKARKGDLRASVQNDYIFRGGDGVT